MKILFFLLIIYSCNYSIDNKSIMATDRCCTIDNDSIDWKIDSCGCLGIRSMALAKLLIEENNLLEKSSSEFIEVFGKPNNTKTDDGVIYLQYYFNTVCDKKKHPIKGADKCRVEFVFKDGLLLEIPKYYDME